MVEIYQIDEDLYAIDLYLFQRPRTSAAYLLLADGVSIIETGVPASASCILEGLDALGIARQEVRRILVTHVHLDHAGGAGVLVREMPWAKVYVHEAAARHLIDPTVLLRGTQQALGELYAFFGETLPLPEENVVGVKEGSIDLGSGKQLQILETPGHAPHHLCFYDEGSRRLFAGEALGTYYEDVSLLFVAVAPPAFDLKAYLATLERLRGLGVDLALLTQFGPSRRVEWLLNENVAQLSHWEGVIRGKLAAGKGARQIIAELQKENAHLRAHLEPAFIDFIFSAMTMGYLLYFEGKDKTEG